MSVRHRLTFAVSTAPDEPDGPAEVMPLVDGVSLVDRVTAYETAAGFTPAGGYGGLVPDRFHFGDLHDHFLGRAEKQWPSPGHAWVLACDCGEVGCWPLTARVVVLDDTVTWLTFGQDHRPQWDYRGFGPFVFDTVQYDRAVTWLVGELADRDR